MQLMRDGDDDNDDNQDDAPDMHEPGRGMPTSFDDGGQEGALVADMKRQMAEE